MDHARRVWMVKWPELRPPLPRDIADCLPPGSLHDWFFLLCRLVRHENCSEITDRRPGFRFPQDTQILSLLPQPGYDVRDDDVFVFFSASVQPGMQRHVTTTQECYDRMIGTSVCNP